jgi:protein-S-isoprenylcysteine O-methyltransferase Ste14
MKKEDRAVEIATYFVVHLAMWVIAPLLGKFVDSLFFNDQKVFADSLLIVLPGASFVLIGLTLSGWAVFLFRTKGQGTPNPTLPPKTLIATGAYRFTRNPIVVGVFLILLGESLLYYSPSLFVMAIIFGLIVSLNIVFIEEPELRKRFGVSYEEYLEQVPRFLPNPFKQR